MPFPRQLWAWRTWLRRAPHFFVKMTENRPEALATRIEAIAAEVCAEHGLVVYDLEVARDHGGRVSVVIERDGGSVPGNGVTVADIAAVSRQVGYLLDSDDVVPFPYQFEVSSPGIERELKNERQVEQNIGRQVRLVLARETEDGRRVVEGVLEEFSGGLLTVRAGESRWEIELDDVRRGRTVFDFDSTKSNGKKKRNQLTDQMK
jgi:ribosome maturation factor RimP